QVAAATAFGLIKPSAVSVKMESIGNRDMSSTDFNRLICTLGSNNSEKEDGGGLILRPRDVIAWDEITTDILFSASRVEKMLMVYANIAVVYESLDNKIVKPELQRKRFWKL
ncbi:unnamed protein product, partial [Brassica oleracea]